jgi:hypothetical protein
MKEVLSLPIPQSSRGPSRNTMNNYTPIRLRSWAKISQFLERSNLQKLTQGKINNANTTVCISEIETIRNKDQAHMVSLFHSVKQLMNMTPMGKHSGSHL